jgi:hypothetical protein
VFFVECGGSIVPDSEHATTAPVGCRIHFDCQGKNANNEPINPKGSPNWTWGPADIVSGGDRNDFTPTVLAVKPGRLQAWVVMDGVQSNLVEITFKP